MGYLNGNKDEDKESEKNVENNKISKVEQICYIGDWFLLSENKDKQITFLSAKSTNLDGEWEVELSFSRDMFAYNITTNKRSGGGYGYGGSTSDKIILKVKKGEQIDFSEELGIFIKKKDSTIFTKIFKEENEFRKVNYVKFTEFREPYAVKIEFEIKE